MSDLPRVQNAEPRSIVAGDTASWYRCLPLYPQGTWVLSYALRGNEPNMFINFSETADPSYEHFISVAPALTALWVAGLYRFQAYVTNPTTSDRVTVGWGDLTVVAGLSANQAQVDPRSFNRQMRDALQQALLSNGSFTGIEHYSIMGRSISKMSRTQLNMLLREYQGYVQEEERTEALRKGRRDPRIVRTAFTYVGGVYPPGGPQW